MLFMDLNAENRMDHAFSPESLISIIYFTNSNSLVAIQN